MAAHDSYARIGPISREMQRLVNQHRKAVTTGYQKIAKHPSIKSEIKRLAELLIPTVPAQTLPAPPAAVTTTNPSGSANPQKTNSSFAPVNASEKQQKQGVRP